jgi:Protein of unknown function (DUF4019)
MRRLLSAICVVLLAVPIVSAMAADDELQADAKAWLSLVDQQQYDASWSAASSLFRSQASQAGWKKAASAAREPLGSLISRTLQETTRATSLPGAPDGEYAVLKFQSRFANKASGIETITLVREDSAWKTAGYFIK